MTDRLHFNWGRNLRVFLFLFFSNRSDTPRQEREKEREREKMVDNKLRVRMKEKNEDSIDDRDKSTVAVKVIPESLMKQTPKLEELVKTEIKVLKTCRNDNVIRFVDNYRTDSNVFIFT